MILELVGGEGSELNQDLLHGTGLKYISNHDKLSKWQLLNELEISLDSRKYDVLFNLLYIPIIFNLLNTIHLDLFN